MIWSIIKFVIMVICAILAICHIWVFFDFYRAKETHEMIYNGILAIWYYLLSTNIQASESK